MMVDLVEDFRNAVRARSNGKRSPGRYPNRARELAVRYLDEVRGAGGKASEAARTLGIDANTLRVWHKKLGRPGAGSSGAGVLPVRVSKPTSSAYLVHGPGNLSVECNSFEEVVELFRALA